jgi:tight adherence protein C
MTLPGISVHDPWALGGIVVLVAALVFSLGGVGLLLYSARMTREAVSKRVGLIRREIPAPARAIPISAALIRSGLRGAKEREQREIIRVMAKFGVAPERAATTLTGVQIVAAATLFVVAFLVALRWLFSGLQLPLLIAIMFGIAGWFIPTLWVDRQINKRTKAIVAGLPDALELLVICVQAGLSFEDGIERVAGALEKTQPALSQELSLTSADMKILPSRDQALINLAGRVDTPIVRSVVTTLSQTLRYGTPLAQALRVVSGELRNETLMRLEERANQLPSLMTIPMMLFIMPTIFMIVGGPAALKVMDAMSHR